MSDRSFKNTLIIIGLVIILFNIIVFRESAIGMLILIALLGIPLVSVIIFIRSLVRYNRSGRENNEYKTAMIISGALGGAFILADIGICIMMTLAVVYM